MELTSQLNYPDSLDSSPHSLTTDSWDEPSLSQPFPPSSKIRLMCSYGGHIVPRPHDKTLCYLGGNTRIVSFDRTTTTLSSLTSTLSSSLLQNRPFSLKYQLPNEDLDSLISIATDEDLDIMIDEYDRFAAASGVGHKPSRIRLFLFPSKPEPASAPSSIDSKSESWFVDALNGADLVSGPHRGMSADVNSLLGLDVGGGDGGGDQKGGKNWPPDVQSVPDSPLVDHTCSPFGSGSSAPWDGGARLPDSKLGLEEQLSRMGIGGGGGGIRQDEVFLPHSPTVAISSPTENVGNRGFLEEGSKNLKSSQPQTPIQSQQKQGNLDLPAEAVSREGNLAGVVSQQKPLICQDPVPSIHAQDRVPNNPVSDPKRDFSNSNYQIPIQIPDMGFSSPMQQEQQHQQQQQQFFQASPHYIHHPVTGQPVPVASYYQMHPLQQNPQLQRLDQQYPMYYLPVGQNQGYNLAFQTNLGDPHSIHSNMPAPMAMNPGIAPPAYKEPAPIYPVKSAPSSKPELSGNMYRTAAGTGPQLIHVSDQQQHPQQQQQQQYMLYHQLHHPQPLAQAPGANFKYEFADPSHAQMYYNQPMATNMATQYQAAGLAAVKPETLRQPVAAETKQNRT